VLDGVTTKEVELCVPGTVTEENEVVIEVGLTVNDIGTVEPGTK
jgi:hypothetical protein